MKAENRGQLVRGYVVYEQWNAGCISMDAALDPNNLKVSGLFTPWHTHDEDLTQCDRELEALVAATKVFDPRTVGSMISGYEYKDYRK